MFVIMVILSLCPGLVPVSVPLTLYLQTNLLINVQDFVAHDHLNRWLIDLLMCLLSTFIS